MLAGAAALPLEGGGSSPAAGEDGRAAAAACTIRGLDVTDSRWARQPGAAPPRRLLAHLFAHLATGERQARAPAPLAEELPLALLPGVAPECPSTRRPSGRGQGCRLRPAKAGQRGRSAWEGPADGRCRQGAQEGAHRAQHR